MAQLTDVVKVFDGHDPITKDQAYLWLADPDLEVAGAAYAYLEKARHAARVVPPLSEQEFALLAVEYLKRCLTGAQRGEWAQSQFEAAWALVSWLTRQATQASAIGDDFVCWLGNAYKARPELRDVIVTGLLEHVAGSNRVDQLFASWERDPELAQALRSAREWTSGGGRSPLDVG